jgi:hypothetical protein
LGLAALLVAAPGLTEAHDGWGRGHGHGHRHRGWHGYGHHHGSAIVIQPSRHTKIVFRGRPYYYGGGRFYEKRVRSYVHVAAPAGITVQELPAYHETVVIDGTRYHCYDGVYYKGGPAGYTVVQLPIASASGHPEPNFQLASAKADGQEMTINVPNANGSYTPVVLRQVNGLYMGPRGEVYSTQPTTEQLKIMYGQ